jgi:hypothetical protein
LGLRRLVEACAVVALLVATAAGGANSKAFSDPTGDSELAPDMTSIAVDNDDEGTLTVRVTVPNRDTWAPDDFLGVYLNTDGNVSTGCVNTHGGDYTLAFLGKAATLTNYFALLHCAGPDYDTSTLQGSFKGSIDPVGHTLTFAVNRRDIGSPKRLSMFLISTSQNAKYLDVAPDTADWPYDVIAPPAPTYQDSFAKAGQTKPHIATIAPDARSVDVLVRWESPADSFDVTRVRLVGANGAATPARIARIRRPDKLCSLRGCRTRTGTSLLVTVVPTKTSSMSPATAARRIRFVLSGSQVSAKTHVRTEVVAKKAERKRLTLRAGAATPKLIGTVGPGFTITLKDTEGKKVTSVKAGTYTFAIRDRSSIHDFTLEQVKGGTFEQVLTGDGFTGSKSVKVKLRPGKWKYVCIAHEPAMFGFFAVR